MRQLRMVRCHKCRQQFASKTALLATKTEDGKSHLLCRQCREKHSGLPSFVPVQQLSVDQLVEFYNDVGQSQSAGFCQRQRIGVENTLKARGYALKLEDAKYVVIADGAQ